MTTCLNTAEGSLSNAQCSMLTCVVPPVTLMHAGRSAAMIPAAMTPVAPTIDDVFLGGIRRAATCVRDWVKMQQQQTLASGCLSCSNGMGVPAEGSCSSSSQSSGLEFCEVQLLPSQPMYYTGDASGTNNSPCKTSTPPTSSPQHKLRSAVIAAAKLAAPCILCSATADTAATTASATATAAKVHDTKMSLWSNDTTASNSIATTPQQPSSPAGSVGSHSGNATSVTPTSSGGESSAGDANTDTVNTNLTTINASTNTTSHTDASTHMIATASSIPDTCINSMPPAAGSGAAPLPGKPRPLNLSQLLASRLECSSPAHSHGSPTCTPSPGRGSVGSEVSLSCLYEDQSMHLLPSAGASQLAGMLRSRSSPACTPPAAQRSGPRVLPKPVPWEGRGCGRPQVLIVLGPADEQDEDKPRGMLQQEVHVQGEAQVATAVPSVAASEAITTGPASVRLSTPQLLASQQAQAGQAVPHSKQPVPAVWDGNVGPVGPNTDSSHQHASAPGHAVYEPALPSLSVAAMAAQDELPADQPPGTQPKTLAELCELLASLEPHTAPESGRPGPCGWWCIDPAVEKPAVPAWGIDLWHISSIMHACWILVSLQSCASTITCMMCMCGHVRKGFWEAQQAQSVDINVCFLTPNRPPAMGHELIFGTSNTTSYLLHHECRPQEPDQPGPQLWQQLCLCTACCSHALSIWEWQHA